MILDFAVWNAYVIAFQGLTDLKACLEFSSQWDYRTPVLTSFVSRYEELFLADSHVEHEGNNFLNVRWVH